MPARRLLVRKIREVLRLKHEQGLSHRAIARACAVSVGTVTLYLQRTVQEGLGWPLPAELDDAALEARLFRREAPVHDRVRPDCAYIHRELKRDGVTLQLLWEEYAQVYPNGYRRTQFCEIYRQWARRLRPSMRQVHRAGEKTFIDFSGTAGPHGPPGFVRRSILAAAVLVVLVVGAVSSCLSFLSEPVIGGREDPGGAGPGQPVGGECPGEASPGVGCGEISHRSARSSCRRHRRPEPGSG